MAEPTPERPAAAEANGSPADGRPEAATADRERAWLEPLAAARYQQAHAYYLLTDRPDPEVVRALSALEDIQGLAREKSWTRAIDRLERLTSRPDLLDWEALSGELERLRAVARALEQRDADTALKLLDELQARFLPAEAATQRGTALVFDNQTEAAREAFEEALEHDPKHYRALTNLGNLALEAGAVDEAIEAYRAALELNDDFANAHHNLGVAYRRKGRIAASVRELKRAQRASQRKQADDARSALGRSGREQGLKLLRWLFYGVLAVLLVLLLRSRGII